MYIFIVLEYWFKMLQVVEKSKLITWGTGLYNKMNKLFTGYFKIIFGLFLLSLSFIGCSFTIIFPFWNVDVLIYRLFTRAYVKNKGFTQTNFMAIYSIHKLQKTETLY